MSTQATQTTQKKIVVIDGGWVVEGQVAPGSYGDVTGYHISDGSVLARWGTTRGLGEIALGGHTPSTVAHPFGDGFIPASSVLFMINCKN